MRTVFCAAETELFSVCGCLTVCDKRFRIRLCPNKMSFYKAFGIHMRFFSWLASSTSANPSPETRDRCFRTGVFRGLTVLALLIATTLLAGPPQVCANEIIPPKLSLADAVAAALESNANLTSIQQSYLSSLSQLRIASFRSTYDVGSSAVLEKSPDESNFSSRIFGSYQYDATSGAEASLTLSPFGLEREPGYVQFSARYPLMRGKGIFSVKSSRIAEALHESSIQEKDVYLQVQATTLGVIESYYRAVLAEGLVDVSTQAVEIAEKTLDMTRRRVDAGLDAGIDIPRAENRVANTKDQLNRQERSAKSAVDRLMLSIGVGVGEMPQLQDSIPDEIPELPTLSDAVSVALANRAELDVYDRRIANQDRRVQLAEDQLRADLDVIARFYATNTGTGLLSTSIFDDGYYAAGVEYSIPLDKRIGIEQRDISERSSFVLDKLRAYQVEEVTEQVIQAYRSVVTARASLDILSQDLDMANDRLRLAQRMVEEGLSSNREVLDAESALTSLRSGILNAKTDLYLSWVDMQHAMGEDLREIVL